VKYNGDPVILSADPDVDSNYPIDAVQAAFVAAVQGSVTAGTTNIQFKPYAKLLSMEEIPAADAIDYMPHTIQTWQLTAEGSITTGTRTAQVEVTAVLDTQKTSTTGSNLDYGAFATSATCGALNWGGSAVVNSYDSSTYNPASGPTITSTNGGLANSDGNIGTNGNLTGGGTTSVYGTLSTPRVGVGDCSSGNVSALTASGGATVAGGVVQLPTVQTVFPPYIVNPNPPTTNLNVVGTSTCATLGLIPPATCSGTTASSGVGLTINPNGSTINWGNLAMSGGAKLTFAGGTYNLNSLQVAGGGSVSVTSGTVNMTIVNQLVLTANSTLNVPATGASWVLDVVTTTQTQPINMSGGSLNNNSFDASKFQIKYAGTGAIAMSGGSKQAVAVYAPNAPVTLVGNSDLYGAVIASTILNTGGADIHYDRHLRETGLFNIIKYAPGNPMLSAFSWKKY
jgi:hypothetical protein